jgi:hypothetical protein
MDKRTLLRKPRFWIALLLILSVSAIVIATGMTPSQVGSTAMSQEIKDTSTKQLAIASLTETPAKLKPKSEAASEEKKSKKRKSKKQEAEQASSADAPAGAPGAMSAQEIDVLNQRLAALIQQAENERTASKTVSKATKDEMNKIKDTLIAEYKAKAEEAKIAGNPDVVLFYESGAKKLEVVVAAVSRDAYQSADFDNLGKNLQPESVALNNVLRKTDKSKVTKEQTDFLRARIVTAYVESMQVTMIILGQILSLINQVSHAVNDPTSFAIGCALQMAVRAAQGQNAFIPPEIEVIRTLSPVLKMKKKIYKETIILLSDLTGETINMPFMKDDDENEKDAKLFPTDK